MAFVEAGDTKTLAFSAVTDPGGAGDSLLGHFYPWTAMEYTNRGNQGSTFGEIRSLSFLQAPELSGSNP